MSRYTAAEKRQIERRLSEGTLYTVGHVLGVGNRPTGTEPGSRTQPGQRIADDQVRPVADADVLRACRAIAGDYDTGAALVEAIHSGTPTDLTILGRTIRELQHEGPEALRAWVTATIDQPHPAVTPTTLVKVFAAVRDARQPRHRR